MCSVSAVHAVTDDIRMKAFFDEIAEVASANYLVRFQSHYGSVQECQSNLSTFGIPSKILPLSVDGEVHCHDHASFLSRLQKMESEQDAGAHEIHHHQVLHNVVANERQRSPSTEEGLILGTEEVLNPGPQDIIMGRGKRASRYVGNRKLRDIFEERYAVYEEGSSGSRKALARSVYLHLIQSGARFLNYSERDNVWSDLDENSAIAKILHGFRNHRIKVNKQSREVMGVEE